MSEQNNRDEAGNDGSPESKVDWNEELRGLVKQDRDTETAHQSNPSTIFATGLPENPTGPETRNYLHSLADEVKRYTEGVSWRSLPIEVRIFDKYIAFISDAIDKLEMEGTSSEKTGEICEAALLALERIQSIHNFVYRTQPEESGYTFNPAKQYFTGYLPRPEYYDDYAEARQLIQNLAQEFSSSGTEKGAAIGNVLSQAADHLAFCDSATDRMTEERHISTVDDNLRAALALLGAPPPENEDMESLEEEHMEFLEMPDEWMGSETEQSEEDRDACEKINEIYDHLREATPETLNPRYEKYRKILETTEEIVTNTSFSVDPGAEDGFLGKYHMFISALVVANFARSPQIELLAAEEARDRLAELMQIAPMPQRVKFSSTLRGLNELKAAVAHEIVKRPDATISEPSYRHNDYVEPVQKRERDGGVEL